MTTTAIIWRNHVDVGAPTTDDFVEKSVPIPQPLDGQVLIDLVYVSVDPYMRGRMRNTPGYFVGPFVPGEPLSSLGVGRVKESMHSKFAVGTYVLGYVQWQQLQVASAEGFTACDEKVLKDVGVPLSVYLGCMGMTGLSAYCGLKEIGKPKEGETAFVSAAAGAVGLVVGQLCKNVYKCRVVVGSAGSDEKVRLLLEYGYDAAFNYKKENVKDALKRLCPEGIDVYFDNVGAEHLEAALDNCNLHAHIVACGSISQYDSAPDKRYGVKNLFNVVTKRVLMQGFIVVDYTYMTPDFHRDMTQYLQEGKVKHTEHVVTGGLPVSGKAFVDLMAGANIGKMVVQCAEDPYRASK